MMQLLAGDIGGTKTILHLTRESGEAIEKRFESAHYASFELLLEEFLRIDAGPIDSACFAVAGPVIGDVAEVTNLHWSIRCSDLQSRFPLGHVSLINDFSGVALGVPLLTPGDLVSLNQGVRRRGEPIGILGAGTGLGQAMVVFNGDTWRVIPSEGGHADFAPQDEKQARLWLHLHERFGHVSWERLLSGHGLLNIYEFLGGAAGDALIVSQRAAQGDPQAREAMAMFVDIYGAEAGNIALQLLSRGGVFLAGGIAAKNRQWFTDGAFLKAFRRKGRFTQMLDEMPIDLIMNERVGLIGAQEMARRVFGTTTARK